MLNPFASWWLVLNELDCRIAPDANNYTPQLSVAFSGYSPSEIRSAYQWDFRFHAPPFSLTDTPIVADGTGQTIAIIDAYHDPNIFANVAAFDSRYNLPATKLFVMSQDLNDPFRPVQQEPQSEKSFKDPRAIKYPWANETALDVEWAHAMAPGATILLVQADKPEDLATAVRTAASVNFSNIPPVSVISMSYGSGWRDKDDNFHSDENSSSEVNQDSLYTTPAGHVPITFIASTGDDHGHGGYPAYSPNVLAVGGTTLHLNLEPSFGSPYYAGETSWANGNSGSAGGYSYYEGRPSYQNSAVKDAHRGVPDVSYDGDPGTGFSIYDRSNGGWSYLGGTSAGAPQWASLVAIVNQGLSINNKPSINGRTGLLPVLYTLKGSPGFNDVASGGRSTPGWDTDTGLGTPVVFKLVDLILSRKNVTDSIIPPPVSFSFTSPSGPFSPGGINVYQVPAPITGIGQVEPPVNTNLGIIPVPSPISTTNDVITINISEGNTVGSISQYYRGYPGPTIRPIGGTPPPGLHFNNKANSYDGYITGQGTYTITVGAGNGIGNEIINTIVFSVSKPSEIETGGTDDGIAKTFVRSGGYYAPNGDIQYFPGQNVNVRTATGDINGDGVADFVGATGPGISNQVVVVDGSTKAVTYKFSPFEKTYTGGLYVLTKDINNDGYTDIIVTPDKGGGPIVVIYDGKKIAAGTGAAESQIVRFYGIEDGGFRGGARAAVGDITGDGVPDIVVSAGFSGGPRIAVFNGHDMLAGKIIHIVGDFFAFESTLRNGAYVTSGDFNGDGYADIAFGGGPGGGPRVRVIDGKNMLNSSVFSNLDQIPNAQIANFFAADSKERGGVRPVAKDVNGDLKDDLLTAAGDNAPGVIHIYMSNQILQNFSDGYEVIAPYFTSSGGPDPIQEHGIYVG
jgi:hypothetical protein